MAQAAGFSCDYCKQFSLGSKQAQNILPPEGWIGVLIRTPQERDNKLDICSNECLMRLAGERVGDEWKKLVSNEYMKEYRAQLKIEREKERGS